MLNQVQPQAGARQVNPSPARSPKSTATAPAAPKASPRVAVLEALTADLEAIYEVEKETVGEGDALDMRRSVRLSRWCSFRGRREIREAKNVDEFAHGVWLLASHYIMEITNGHAVSHGIYDSLPGNAGLDSKSYEWWNTVVLEDWKVDHNEVHHPFTNIIGTDDDYGFLLLRLSGRQPWRPWHLAQPLVMAVLPVILTAYFPTFLAMARARFEERPVLSRQTLLPAAHKVFDQLRQNYVDEPAAAGVRAPQVVLGHWLAKVISNIYITFMLSVEHHAGELLDFDPDPDETKEVFYLRQLLGTKNFHTDERHEDLYTLGVNIHTEHHMFPDLPIHRLRRVEEKVRAACARHGVPHNSESWPRAIGALLKNVALFSLPIRTTRARERRRALFDRLVGELREVQAMRAAEAANAEAHADAKADVSRQGELHTVYLAKRGMKLSVSSETTLLEAIEGAGVTVPTGCRKGACKTCKTRKLSGRTTIERNRVRDAVELCVARPVSDIELDI